MILISKHKHYAYHWSNKRIIQITKIYFTLHIKNLEQKIVNEYILPDVMFASPVRSALLDSLSFPISFQYLLCANVTFFYCLVYRARHIFVSSFVLLEVLKVHPSLRDRRVQQRRRKKLTIHLVKFFTDWQRFSICKN